MFFTFYPYSVGKLITIYNYCFFKIHYKYLKDKHILMKHIVLTGISIALLTAMQITRADPISFELSETEMDKITAGGRATANAYALSKGDLTSTRTNTLTHANEYVNYGVAIAVATSCCDNSGSTTADTNASATGHVVRTLHGKRSGFGYSISWSIAYGY